MEEQASRDVKFFPKVMQKEPTEQGPHLVALPRLQCSEWHFVPRGTNVL